MFRGKLVVALAASVALIGVSIGGALAQEATPSPQPQPQPGFRGGPRGMQRDPDEMRQRLLESVKEALGVKDDEWQVIQPRIEKVQTLSRQVRTGGMMGMVGMFGRQGGRRRERPEEARPRGEQSEVQKAFEALRTVLENKDAKPEDIKSKLTALREAQEKAKQQLAKAQQELRELLTVRQEAQLVLMGLLD